MRKITVTILSLLSLTALSVASAAGLCAQKPITATAETTQTPTASERLLAPDSYEEYLRLTAPADVAVNDRYVAISEQNFIFIFDRTENLWQKYVHSERITKLGFGRRNDLYFLDGKNTLALLDVSALTESSATDTGIVCSTFSVHGDHLYFINTSGNTTSISSAPLTALSESSELFSDRMYAPALSFWNGAIYYVNGENLHKLQAETLQDDAIAMLPSNASSMLISEGILFCTTDDGSFYGYELTELTEKSVAKNCTPLVEETDGYSALSANGGDVYVTNGNTVRLYSLESKGFVDYEIGGSSASSHRLNEANEIVLSGDKLFIADNGNDRISVYDANTAEFQAPIPSAFDATFLAGYNETLLCANADQATLYDLREDRYGETLAVLESTAVSGKIVGATCIYDTYYLLTDSNYCYSLETDGETAFTWQETLRKTHYAEVLTSDVNGNIYILNGGAVYRYREEDFNSATETGVKLCGDLPEATKKLSVDYAGKLYALAEGTVYCYAPSATDGLYTLENEYIMDESMVYDVTPNALSFAFGIEENQAYVLYKGDYLTVTTAWELPTVKTISSGTAATEIFRADNADFTLVKTTPNSLLVEFDLTKLQGSDVFPYTRYYRAEDALTALKIGETTDYAILRYTSNDTGYATCFVAKSQIQAMEQVDYATVYETAKTGYVTNDAQLYKFPDLDLISLTQLSKNAEIKLIGEITLLGEAYYAVEYETGKIGYLPKPYATLFNGAPPTTETVVYGDADNGADDIWRLFYLLLGAAAICILTDFLLLRNKDNP